MSERQEYNPTIGTWAPTPTFLYRHHLYRRLLAGSQDRRLLDIGTGNGWLLAWLEQHGFAGEAIDFSAAAVARAKARIGSAGNVRLRHQDFFDLPLTGRYDQILCFEVLEYVPADLAFVQKIAHHLNPGGRLLLSVPAHMAYWSAIDSKRGHLRRYERPELEALVTAAGLTIARFWSYGYPLLTALRAVNNQATFVRQHGHKNQRQLAEESSLVQEYHPHLQFLFNQVTLAPLFALLDAFLTSDRGLGYLVEATALKAPAKPKPW